MSYNYNLFRILSDMWLNGDVMDCYSEANRITFTLPSGIRFTFKTHMGRLANG